MEDEQSHSIEYEESIWGPHEFCEFKCGPDCDQEAELHPKVTVIYEDGEICTSVQAHWDNGDWTVGIPAGYFLDDEEGPEDTAYIIAPAWAADVLPENLKELAKKYLETSNVHA